MTSSTIPPTLLEVKTARGIYMVTVADLFYLEARNKHTFLYLADGTSLESYSLLKWFQHQLPFPYFCRCHDSYLVNCRYIQYLCGYRFVLKNNAQVPISRRRLHQSKITLQCFLGQPVHPLTPK